MESVSADSQPPCEQCHGEGSYDGGDCGNGMAAELYCDCNAGWDARFISTTADWNAWAFPGEYKEYKARKAPKGVK